MARRLLTPSIVRAGMAREPRAKETQLKEKVEWKSSEDELKRSISSRIVLLPDENSQISRQICLHEIPNEPSLEDYRHMQLIPHSCWVILKITEVQVRPIAL